MTAGSEPPAGARPASRGAWQRMSAAWRSGPLAVRSFQLLTGGQLASTAGDFCYAVALPWLVLSAHGGPVLLGAVLACYGVPRTVLIPLGGMLADKTGGDVRAWRLQRPGQRDLRNAGPALGTAAPARPGDERGDAGRA